MTSAIKGFLLPLSGLRLIARPGLRRFVLVPLLLNIVVFGGLAYLAGSYFDQAMDRWLPQQDWLEFLRWLSWILFATAYAVTVFYSFTLVANLIAAPFNAGQQRRRLRRAWLTSLAFGAGVTVLMLIPFVQLAAMPAAVAAATRFWVEDLAHR
jgi:uncharacterized protein involved in cysteine biosynthesis